jgi:light-regulated signal transduction histidine kinase (bacteriophytochrome)
MAIDKPPQDFLQFFSFWRTEGLNPIVSITGYSRLLLDGTFGELTEKQREIISTINYAANAAATAWRNPSIYLKLTSDPNYGHLELQSVSLAESFEKINSHYLNDMDIVFELPPTLPNVKTDITWLKEVIAILIRPSAGYYNNRSFLPKIVAQLKNDMVAIQVYSGLSLYPEQLSIESISFPGSSVSVANIILQKLGSELRLEQIRLSNSNDFESQGTMFEFALPIWQDKE